MALELDLGSLMKRKRKIHVHFSYKQIHTQGCNPRWVSYSSSLGRRSILEPLLLTQRVEEVLSLEASFQLMGYPTTSPS